MRRYLRFLPLTLAFGLLVPSIGHAANLAPLQVFTDAVADGVLLADATPESADLVAGYISEANIENPATATISFTWEVVDILDGTQGIPELQVFYWDMSIDPDATVAGDERSFQVVARLGRSNIGELNGNCTTNQANLTSCVALPGVVTVSVDAAADTVTATVARKSLKYAGQSSVAVNGAKLSEVKLFQGIASYISPHRVITSSAGGDQADLDEDYILGAAR